MICLLFAHLLQFLKLSLNISISRQSASKRNLKPRHIVLCDEWQTCLSTHLPTHGQNRSRKLLLNVSGIVFVVVVVYVVYLSSPFVLSHPLRWHQVIIGKECHGKTQVCILPQTPIASVTHKTKEWRKNCWTDVDHILL